MPQTVDFRLVWSIGSGDSRLSIRILEQSFMRRARFGLGMNVKIWAGISMLLALGGFFPSVGRAEQKSALTEPEPKTLQTEDRVNLHITYYRSTGDRESPVVVLLHMKDSNRFVWQAEDGFARTLQKEGYAVITVDLRHFGDR